MSLLSLARHQREKSSLRALAVPQQQHKIIVVISTDPATGGDEGQGEISQEQGSKGLVLSWAMLWCPDMIPALLKREALQSLLVIVGA